MTIVAPTPRSAPAPRTARTGRTGRTAAPGSRRDPAVDLVRAACLVAVVAVHALMVGVSVTGDGVVLENALEAWDLFTPFSWVAQMMPLFFILGGFASATHLRRERGRGVRGPEYVALRLRRLLPVPLAAAVATTVALAVLAAAGLDPELVAEAGWRISQPLWFLGVYVLCTAFVPLALRAHERAPRRAVAALGAAVLAVDAIRWVSGVDAVGCANLLFVWLLVQQLGFWLADGRAPSLRQAAWAAAGIAGLIVVGASPANLFEALNPPTAALALLGVVQLAAFAALRHRLAARAGLPRVRRAVDAINGTAMTIYSWHMPVVVLLAGLLLAAQSAPGAAALLPAPLSGDWWLGRPAWLVAAGVAVTLAVSVAGRIERRPRGAAGSVPAGRPGAVSARRAALGVLSGAGGVLVILTATGALWAWALGAALIAAAVWTVSPARLRPADQIAVAGAVAATGPATRPARG
ncbi:acyltransferase family protein [Leucobacter luti]|uniref:Acyltransferase-like protein n=1 Tax=Leucobacter luti TaxID=340320 RepID=A0A4Q7TPK5_9MICO|nr:acyltransferase [Leucobacter luti]MBL3699963.1 acyltransferase [Leucobacter luti]RZT62721.1 acyltransferase-like protein [Leucobacter luti]